MNTKIIICFFLLSVMTGCNKNKENKIDTNQKNEAGNHPDTMSKIKISDSSDNINSEKDIFFKDDKVCAIITEEEDNSFLNDFIFYFRTNTISREELNDEKYYQFILQRTKVFEFPDYYFKKDSHTFSLKNKHIKDYGKCFIAEYYFNDTLGYMQKKFYVIVNIEKREISIWNFDNLNVSKKGLECDFNVRGNHSIYNFLYSTKCKKFIPTLAQLPHS